MFSKTIVAATLSLMIAGPCLEAVERPSGNEFDARRRVRTAEQLIQSGEHERAVSALQSLIAQYPESSVRFKARLLIGRDLLFRQQDSAAAIDEFLKAAAISKTATDDAPLTADALDIQLEAQHLIGVAHYRSGNFAEAFPVLRRITVDHPNSSWANHSFYYIGMAHFMQQNWARAIRYLEMVGTFVDPNGAESELIEAGQRLYVRVEDGDLPIMERLGQQAEAAISTSSGDQVVVPLVALSRSTGTFIASAPTEIGPIVANDDTLQVLSGDTVEISYRDANTNAGEANVERLRAARVVNTAAVYFSDATWEGRARGAFIGQPVFIVIEDADLSTEKTQNSITITITSEYKDLEERQFDLLSEEEVDASPRWKIRDEQQIVLMEQPNKIENGPSNIYRSGAFRGSLQLIEASEEATSEAGRLQTAPGDRVVIRYKDQLHSGGSFEQIVEATIPVAGRYTGSLEKVGGDMAEAVNAARKNLIESRAYLELARIFADMGLHDGASGQVAEGMDRCAQIIRQDGLPPDLVQQAFVLRWEMQILTEDLEGAIATCNAFNRRFPESRYADQALLRIGQALIGVGEYEQARAVLSQIVSLEDQEAIAEAQFLIAQAIEAEAGSLEPAIPTYESIANRFPQTSFAGEALGRLIQYHIDERDYVTATDMLRSVFEQYPDKDWLDRMLVRWAVLAYRQGDMKTSLEKAQRLLLEYPDSPQVGLMKQLVGRIAQRSGN